MKGYSALPVLLLLLTACGDEMQNAGTDSVKADSLSHTFTAGPVDSSGSGPENDQFELTEYDSISGFTNSIHRICIDDYIYTACATIMVRPPQENNVAVYAKKCFREWLKNQVGHGLLIYLGADSLGCLWTIEAEQADASGYYFARLCCRNEGHGLMYRSLLDSHLDCDYEAFDAAIVYPFNKRLDVYAEEFALERLALDVTTTEVAKAGTMANASGVGYDELKLTVNTTDGKTHRWFFAETADMCWSSYSWDVR